MNLDEIAQVLFWMLITFLPVGTFAWIMTFSPQVVVRWQARFYHKMYKDVFQLPDAEIDRPYQLPWDNASMGRRSVFLRRGLESPESYEKLLKAYRALGWLAWSMLGCEAAALIMYVSSLIKPK